MRYLTTSNADPATDFALSTMLTQQQQFDLASVYPSWLDTKLEQFSSVINARLRKVCPQVPFVEPNVPAIIKSWLHRLVDAAALDKLGVSQLDPIKAKLDADAKAAAEELAEAASGELSKFDLPTADGENGSAMTKLKIRMYTENSPFVHRDIQRAAGRDEDRNGTGTRR